VSRIERADLGDIADITSDLRHRFVVGERGLQVVDRLAQSDEAQPVEDYIQLEADSGVALKGRFALTVGHNALQVFDMAPYYNSRAVVSKLKPAKKRGKNAPPEEETAPAAPTDAPPAEVAPAEGTSAPAEAKPADAAPADGASGSAAPAESEAKPSEAAPAEAAPAESQPSPQGAPAGSEHP
jgi:hypothetical protein